MKAQYQYEKNGYYFTEWVGLPEGAGGEQQASAGLRLAPLFRPSTCTGMEQICSKGGVNMREGSPMNFFFQTNVSLAQT